MELPNMNKTNTSETMINAFMGLNKGYRIDDAEFSSMKNMTNDYYPVMSPRDKRGIIKTISGKFHGMANQTEKLVWVEDTRLYYDSTYVTDVEDSDKQFAQMGAYLIIWPDKIAYNTQTDEVIKLEAEYTSTGDGTTENPYPEFRLCKLNGDEFTDDNTYTGDTEPDHSTYKYWIDTSADTVVIKLWSSNTAQWTSVGTTYVKVYASGINKDFSEYDGVSFTGVNGGSSVYNDYNFNTTNIIYGAGSDDHGDYLIIVGLINKQFFNTGNITLKREVPDMDFICEMDNRIWGCSSKNHEIYASKLGDPKNFNFFMGVSTDSYAATVGTGGDFTGCISHRGYVLFFKDRGFHKLYGTQPSNFTMSYVSCRGVQPGSEKSLLILNERLYYKSRDGFVVYDGSMPESISEKLGTEPLYEARAGAFRNKYYVCCRDSNYNWYQLVYDTTKGTWIEEETKEITGYGYMDGAMYFIIDNTMYTVNIEKILTKLLPSYPFQRLALEGTLSEDAAIFTDTAGDVYRPNTKHLYWDNTTCKLYTYSESLGKYEETEENSEKHFTNDASHILTYPADTRELIDKEGNTRQITNPEDDFYFYKTEYFYDLSGEELSIYPQDVLYPNDVPKGEQFEDDVEWEAETGDIGMDNPYNEYISKITMRLTIGSGAILKVAAQYDSSGVWEPLIEYHSTAKRSYTIPITVARCDHLQLKFSGIGDVKIYSISKVREVGSEVTEQA